MAFPNSLPTFSFVVHCKVSRINACGCCSPHSKLCLPICRHQHHVLLSEDNGSRSNASSDRLWIRNFKVPISVVSNEYIDYTGILPWPCHPLGGGWIWLCQEQVPIRKGWSEMKPLTCPEHKASLLESKGCVAFWTKLITIFHAVLFSSPDLL